MTPHNNAPEGAYAKTVLMPGDPLRAKFLADNFLTDVKQVNTVRNCFGYTGLYKGKPVSVQASGMGMPSIGIYSWELFSFYGVENIIRIGSAGSYSEDLDLQQVVLADSAYSDSSYAMLQSGFLGHVNWPSQNLNKAIQDKAHELGISCKQCRIHSSDVFYTNHASETFRETAERTESKCVEMEAFSLFQNARLCGKNAACILTISDSFVTTRELTAEDRQNSFVQMMKLALETAISLG